jgi:hypothetical protein
MNDSLLLAFMLEKDPLLLTQPLMLQQHACLAFLLREHGPSVRIHSPQQGALPHRMHAVSRALLTAHSTRCVAQIVAVSTLLHSKQIPQKHCLAPNVVNRPQRAIIDACLGALQRYHPNPTKQDGMSAHSDSCPGPLQLLQPAGASPTHNP